MTKQIDELMRLADEYAFPTSVNTETGQVHASDMESARAALVAVLEAALGQSQAVPASALKQGVPITWAEAEEIAIRPSVEDAIEVLLEDQTLDNATGVVMAVLNAARPAQTPVKQCAQCGKEHKKCSSGGCPKCAPGVVVSESEFRKPITAPPRLTDEQLSQVMERFDFTYAPTKFARAIETVVRKQLGYD